MGVKTQTSFKKGHNKVGGRNEGTPNKQTKDIKELIGKLLEAIDKIGVETIVNGVEGEDKGYSALMKALVRLAPQNLKIEADINSPPIIIKIDGKIIDK